MMSIRKGIVYFQRLDKFDPERDIYIHVVDIADIPGDKMVWTNEFELEIDLDEITPLRIEIHKAGEISQYLEIVKSLEEFQLRRSS